MYEELVKRLRSAESNYQETLDCLSEAADAIEELQKVVEKEQAFAKCWEEMATDCKDRFQELLDAYPKWIPVTERLPEICTNVLVAGRMKYRWEHKYLQFVDKAYFNEGEFFESSNDWYEGQDEFEITHWMPLPEPPTAEEDE